MPALSRQFNGLQERFTGGRRGGSGAYYPPREYPQWSARTRSPLLRSGDGAYYPSQRPS